MVVQFRNLTSTWHDPLDQWPYEAVVTTMERGLVSDWQTILTDLRARPFGRIARYVAHYAKNPEDEAVAAFFWEALRRARLTQETVNEMRSFGEFGVPLRPPDYPQQTLPALLKRRHPDSARICPDRSHRLL